MDNIIDRIGLSNEQLAAAEDLYDYLDGETMDSLAKLLSPLDAELKILGVVAFTLGRRAA